MKNVKLLKEIRERKLIGGKTLEIFEIINKYDGITSMEITRLYNKRHPQAKSKQNIVGGRIAELVERGFVVAGDKVFTKSKRFSTAWTATSEMPETYQDLNKDKLKKKLQDRDFKTSVPVEDSFGITNSNFDLPGLDFDHSDSKLQVTAAVTLEQKTVMEQVASFFKGLF